MRKFGHTQMSVCIDLFGDVFLYREAGFLNQMKTINLSLEGK